MDGAAVTSEVDSSLQQIVGEQLSAVTFVMDYVQLQFNPPPMLNALTPITVRSASGAARSGQDQFRNRLCEQIAKTVASVMVNDEEFLIIFDDQSTISISLRSEDCVGPESIVFHGRNNICVF
jgi:hypothetical protein